MPYRLQRRFALLTPLLLATALAAQVDPSSPPDASAGSVATAMKGGNLGMGVDVLYGLTPDLAGRTGLTLKGLTSSDAETRLYWTANALVDWQPRSWKGFRLTGGLGFLDTEPSSTQISSMGKFGAYAGLGWGNAFSSGSRWRFLVDVGGYYRLGGVYEQHVQYSASPAGKRALDAGYETTYSEQSRFVPMLSLGASYRF